MTDQLVPVLSPCRKICELDASAQYCIGCFRTVEEIATWARMTPAERAEVVDALPEREAGGMAPQDKPS